MDLAALVARFRLSLTLLTLPLLSLMIDGQVFRLDNTVVSNVITYAGQHVPRGMKHPPNFTSQQSHG